MTGIKQRNQMNNKIVLAILGIVPLVLSLGGMAFAGVLMFQTMSGQFDDNPTLKAANYAIVAVIGFIIVGFLWAGYKILAYMRNH